MAADVNAGGAQMPYGRWQRLTVQYTVWQRAWEVGTERPKPQSRPEAAGRPRGPASRARFEPRCALIT